MTAAEPLEFSSRADLYKAVFRWWLPLRGAPIETEMIARVDHVEVTVTAGGETLRARLPLLEFYSPTAKEAH
jgi:hypothetical protein